MCLSSNSEPDSILKLDTITAVLIIMFSGARQSPSSPSFRCLFLIYMFHFCVRQLLPLLLITNAAFAIIALLTSLVPARYYQTVYDASPLREKLIAVLCCCILLLIAALCSWFHWQIKWLRDDNSHNIFISAVKGSFERISSWDDCQHGSCPAAYGRWFCADILPRCVLLLMIMGRRALTGLSAVTDVPSPPVGHP